ncbi:metal-dependent hydrolase [Halosimplex rubrum]|uniref:Metal-dependent hydrolase n=1 Tax=Halosimplex rubrum TaxID=869889 RepID=A0A7D5P717_9EURY|nr:metal-dependent hydrolase [Halosimplex rubrum]QLH76160.1 metal-dependent hydrolase [Halosimplex rubrum]
MWPWGHLAMAYLVYSLYARFGRGHRPTAAATLVVAFGSQFPDLVDKPLAWTLSILPTGRSLAHSLLVVGPVVALLYTVAAAREEGEEPLVVAFGIGALVHTFGDALYSLVALEFREAGFMLWPAVPPLESEVEQSFAAHFALVDLSPELSFEFLLVGVAAVVWRADGYPGLATVLALPGRAWRGVTGAE